LKLSLRNYGMKPVCVNIVALSWRTTANVNTKWPLNGTFTAILCYFWLIVYSHYRQLERELLASSEAEEVISPLTVVSYPCPKYEDEGEIPHHRIWHQLTPIKRDLTLLYSTVSQVILCPTVYFNISILCYSTFLRICQICQSYSEKINNNIGFKLLNATK
jgi:hypothetical protein